MPARGSGGRCAEGTGPNRWAVQSQGTTARLHPAHTSSIGAHDDEFCRDDRPIDAILTHGHERWFHDLNVVVITVIDGGPRVVGGANDHMAMDEWPSAI